MSTFPIALSFRLLNAFISRSFFQPDEYWQSLEVAHLSVFGYGWKTWEWRTLSPESQRQGWIHFLKDGGEGGIRSPLSILPTALVYAGLRRFKLEDRGDWLVLAPRLLQACVAASTDVAVERLARRLLGREYGNAALVVSLTSFFNFYTSTRTFSNSTETALTAWALYWWPWELYSDSRSALKDDEDENKPKSKQRRIPGTLLVSLSFAALATIIRPSNAVIWLVLGSRLFLQSSARERFSIVSSALIVTTSAILVSLALDTSFYDTRTFTPLRFLSTNVLHSISLFYGQNPWHFYLFQAIPLLLLTQLPFFLDGLHKLFLSTPVNSLRSRSALVELGLTALGTVTSYSLLSHKEWRFLHPLLPIFHLFVTLSLVTSFDLHQRNRSRIANEESLPLLERITRRSRIKFSHLSLLSISLFPAIYLTTFHQRGQNDVMIWLRDEMRSQKTTNEPRGGQGMIKTVGFAMPCHSTPWQSHLHSRELESQGRLWFLTCEPPISGQARQVYLDQSDHFYLSPCTYFHDRFPPTIDPSFPPSIVRTDLDATTESTTSTTATASFDLGWKYDAWPSHLVVFRTLLEEPCRCQSRREGEERDEREGRDECGNVGELLLRDKGYRIEKEFWNGVRGWHEDERRRGGIVVLKWYGFSSEGREVAG